MNLWDKKARNFPRFRQDSSEVLEILDFFNQNGVNFKNKIILDIGCGNGRFALQLAQNARLIIAIDSSQKMLENLQLDCKKYNIQNIAPKLCAWDDFNYKRELSNIALNKINIAFAAMTPALNNKTSFFKALEACSEHFCYIGWGRRRECEFLEEILKIHNIKLRLPCGLPDALTWLDEKNINCISAYKNGSYVYESSDKETFDDIKWHILQHNGIPNEPKIKDFIAAHAKNGRISYAHTREIGLALIKKS